MAQRLALAGDALHQHLNLAAGFLGAKQPCWNHLSVVKHQQITGANKVDHIRKVVMTQPSAGQGQQPRTGALSRRAASDKLIGQIKIKVSNIHHALPAWGQGGDDRGLIDQNHGLWPPDWYTAARLPEWRNGRRDRKSTRLNSSHVRISYAVFCLKKKKKKKQ